MSLPPHALLLLLSACAGDSEPADPADDTAAPVTTRGTLAGSITWEVDFDEVAEAGGATDCSYTRDYSGSEDLSAPWLCPACTLLFHADTALQEGDAACYAQVSTSDPTPSEWLGYADGLWYRAASSALTERGPASVEGDTLTVSQEVDSEASNGDALTFSIHGSLRLGEEAGDPLHGWGASETYACGWPKADPPPYSGDYTADVGDPLPDGLFPDVCEDRVRLHDFAGKYLVIDVSAMDCGPCRSAAADEHAFVTAMAAEGLAVEVLTLLAPSLSDTAGTATTEDLTWWIDTYGLDSPVLGDRVWGLSVARPAVGEDEFGYPTFLVVAPDLTVIGHQVGYSSFDKIADQIRGDAR